MRCLKCLTDRIGSFWLRATYFTIAAVTLHRNAQNKVMSLSVWFIAQAFCICCVLLFLTQLARSSIWEWAYAVYYGMS